MDAVRVVVLPTPRPPNTSVVFFFLPPPWGRRPGVPGRNARARVPPYQLLSSPAGRRPSQNSPWVATRAATRARMTARLLIMALICVSCLCGAGRERGGDEIFFFFAYLMRVRLGCSCPSNTATRGV